MHEREFLTVKELSKYLKVSKKFIYENVKCNEIPHYKFGKIIRFERRDVDTWFDTYRREGYFIERRAKEILKELQEKINRTSQKELQSTKRAAILQEKRKPTVVKNLTHGKGYTPLSIVQGGLNTKEGN